MGENKILLMGVTVSVGSYCELRYFIKEIIKYFSDIDVYKETLNTSTLMQKLFYTNFKDLLPKHIFVFNNIYLILIVPAIAISLLLFVTGINNDFLLSYIENLIYFLVIISVILGTAFGVDNNGLHPKVDRIYGKKDSKKHEKKN